MSYGPMSDAHRAAIKAGHARNRAGDGFLYVALCDHGKTIKIGCALNPERRLISWRIKPNILARTKGGYADERRLHQQLKAYRNGYGYEWYEPTVLDHPAVQAVFGDLRSMRKEAA